METFLFEVAQRLKQEHPNDLDKVCVVFNNRRPTVFLKDQFKKNSSNAFFLPTMISMDELVKKMGGMEIIPNEFLLFELYDIHRNIEKKEDVDSFEKFISIADMMMADFSEIDLYLVDPQEIFSNLSDIKAIGEWDIEGHPITPMQQRYLAFYKSLYTYYAQLHTRLESQHKAYSGMAYRHVAENIDSMIDTIKFNHIYFVGFNVVASTEIGNEKNSEKTIIEAFVRRGIGTLITDGDRYYCDDETQEAGKFMRKLNKWIPQPIEHPDHFSKEHKDITLVSCPEDILQVAYTGNKLKEIVECNNHGTNALENTAVVLADEGLLIPMLNSLPESIGTANVTMGFPFQLSGIHTYILKLISLHKHSRNEKYYHVDLVDLLSDRYTCLLLGVQNIHSKLLSLMDKEKPIYSDKETVHHLVSTIGLDPGKIDFLFTPIDNNPMSLLEICLQICHRIVDGMLLSDDAKERESLACFIEIANYLKQLQESHLFVNDLATFERIYTRLAQRHSVAFYGEPLGGLQILGMLETRNLDFDRLFILSANEGTLPAGRSSNTLIPYSLKRHFGIPTHQEKDAVYAYNFYRLLQRATDIRLLYNTETEGMSKGEPSRFILQIRNELSQRFPNIDLHEEVLSILNEQDSNPLRSSIPKDETILKKLSELGDKGFSPTALNTYLDCPLKFYYKYVLGLYERKELSEDIDDSEQGSCIHDILQDIHSKDDKFLRIETIQKALDNIGNIVETKYQEDYLKGRSPEGRNSLSIAISKTQIEALLKHEISLLQEGHTIEIVALEKEYSATLKFETQGVSQTVKIKGRADRVDRVDGQLRIVDYKSGRATAEELRIKGKSPSIDKITEKWLQVMTYAWLYSNNVPVKEEMMTGIIPLKQLNGDLFTAEWDGVRCFNQERLLDFQGLLQQVISEIFDPDKSFTANNKKGYCKYCPFSSICPK